MDENMEKMEVHDSLNEIGDVLVSCLKYEPCPIERLDKALNLIDGIINDPDNLKSCEYYFKSAGGNYVLFFFSNIIYNLKTKNDLYLTTDVLKWLAGVWKNFIKRNKTYQNFFKLHKIYGQVFKNYFDEDSSFINRLTNINNISDQFLKGDQGDDSELARFEKFYQVTEEIVNVMKPTYFFLLDFIKERKIATGNSLEGADNIEKEGLANFGYDVYTYKKVIATACKTLAILEGVYLLLKKKKSTRQFRIFDGKKKFVTTAEIYDIYSEKFDLMKKEYVELK
jgi:hypothetical protein